MRPEWKERAEAIHQHGVPEQRAKVVALREDGLSYGEIASKLGFGAGNDDRSQVKYHLDAYREQHENAEWLVVNGPNLSSL